MQSFWSPNYLLSFGGPQNDLLVVSTNEDQTTPNNILLFYIKNILLYSNMAPFNESSYLIQNPGLYFVKGLMNNPVNKFFAYLFVIDKNVGSGTFGVFKLDFTATP